VTSRDPHFRKPHLDALAITLLLACCIYWGLQQILIKITVGEMPPFWQAALRFGAATALLWLWCLWRGIPLFKRDGSLWPGLLAGSLFAGELIFIYLGLRDTSASRMTVFLYCAPFVVALLLPRIVPSERLRGWQWLGLLLAFAGVALAFEQGFSHGQGLGDLRQFRGDVLALLAGIAWGLTTLVIRGSRMATISPEKTLFYQVAVTTVATFILSLLTHEPWGWNYSTATWASLIVQAAIGAFASYLAWMWMLRHYPATRISAFTFITPVCGLLFGVLLLHEPLTVQLVLALAGVAVGLVLVNRKAGAS
jgi:drug/metabolite transporter (DMT)-like permease